MFRIQIFHSGRVIMYKDHVAICDRDFPFPWLFLERRIKLYISKWIQRRAMEARIAAEFNP